MCVFRYLLHVFMEACCLEWCVVIGLILRDAAVIKQVVCFLDSPEVPSETVQSIRAGLMAVDRWASSDWSVSISLSLITFSWVFDQVYCRNASVLLLLETAVLLLLLFSMWVLNSSSCVIIFLIFLQVRGHFHSISLIWSKSFTCLICLELHVFM